MESEWRARDGRTLSIARTVTPLQGPARRGSCTSSRASMSPSASGRRSVLQRLYDELEERNRAAERERLPERDREQRTEHALPSSTRPASWCWPRRTGPSRRRSATRRRRRRRPLRERHVAPEEATRSAAASSGRRGRGAPREGQHLGDARGRRLLVAWSCTPPTLDDRTPFLITGVDATCESARRRSLRASRQRLVEAGDEERRRLDAEPPRRRPTAAGRDVDLPPPREDEAQGRPCWRGHAARGGGREPRPRLSRAARACPRHPPCGSHRPRAPPCSSPSPPGRPPPWRSTSPTSGCRGRSRRPRTTSSSRRSRTCWARRASQVSVLVEQTNGRAVVDGLDADRRRRPVLGHGPSRARGPRRGPRRAAPSLRPPRRGTRSAPRFHSASADRRARPTLFGVDAAPADGQDRFQRHRRLDCLVQRLGNAKVARSRTCAGRSGRRPRGGRPRDRRAR